ncbi:MAG: hypothetical protein AB200_00395 [Parcubacteria bacterium C7867-005]|nr:MAG: hypothetical protein AB200_00395 [Parcubacteria bacterium C7867-005]
MHRARLYLLLAVGIFLTACRNETNVFGPGNGPNGPNNGPDGGRSAFASAGFRPADTTIVVSTRYHALGQIFVEQGRSPNLLIRTRQCVQYVGSPLITWTGQSGWYNVDVTLQGVATCRDSIVFKFAHDTTITTFIRATVVSAPGGPGIPTMTVTPPGGSGPVGTGSQSNCIITGVTDTRCWAYSTDPSRIAVVQKDTTFATATNPWTAGSHLSGEIRFMFAGSANICRYWVVDPRVAQCHQWNATVPSLQSSDMMSASYGLRDAKLSEEGGRLYEVVLDRMKQNGEKIHR